MKIYKWEILPKGIFQFVAILFFVFDQIEFLKLEAARRPDTRQPEPLQCAENGKKNRAEINSGVGKRCYFQIIICRRRNRNKKQTARCGEYKHQHIQRENGIAQIFRFVTEPDEKRRD